MAGLGAVLNAMRRCGSGRGGFDQVGLLPGSVMNGGRDTGVQVFAQETVRLD